MARRATSTAERHQSFPDVDHFVLNEAEVTLAPFLEDVGRGSAQRLYTSTTYPDVARHPHPVWELANLRKYGSVSIQFSRGCPFNCDFCNVTALFGHRPQPNEPLGSLRNSNPCMQRDGTEVSSSSTIT